MTSAIPSWDSILNLVQGKVEEDSKKAGVIPPTVEEAEAKLKHLETNDTKCRQVLAEAAKRSTSANSEQSRQQLAIVMRHVSVLQNEIQSLSRVVGMSKVVPTRRMHKIQVAVCLDGTGSMAPVMAGVKETISCCCEQMVRTTGLSVELALVVYRDYSDYGPQRGPTATAFTGSEEFIASLAAEKATGGDDPAEDCLGGLQAVASLPWNPNDIHVCLWSGDAPGHGLHDGSVGDNYPGGDKNGLDVPGMCKKLHEKDISLAFGRLTPQTDVMIEMFKKGLIAVGAPEMPQVTLDPARKRDFADALLGMMMTSAGQSRSTGTGTIPSRRREVAKSVGDAAVMRSYAGKMGLMQPITIASSGVATNGSLIANFVVGGALTQLIKILQTSPPLKFEDASIRVDPGYFAAGGVRFAYHCVVNRKCVAKDFQHAAMNRRENHVSEMCGLSVASYMAALFCHALELPMNRFRYVASQLFIDGATSSTASCTTCFSIEELLEGNFEKWNSNAGFVKNTPEAMLPNAFSHFTYNVSEGKLMVLDLQGTQDGDAYILTDPAVQTIRDISFQNPTNVGEPAMEQFFQAHKCNEYCARLKLPNLNRALMQI